MVSRFAERASRRGDHGDLKHRQRMMLGPKEDRVRDSYLGMGDRMCATCIRCEQRKGPPYVRCLDDPRGICQAGRFT